ncbi:MAG: PEP-CTERM sorting domain-containing protein [Planctomycetota bacterium]
MNNFSTFNFDGYDTDNTSFADAVADDEIWTFGFDVTGAVFIDLTTFDIRLDRSGTGPDDFEIQVSVNGDTPVSVLTFDYGDTTAGVDFLGVDLSALPTLTTGDSVVFTLGAFNSESTAGSFDLETIDFGGSDPRALRIEGTITAIPEPASLGLLAVGGLLIAGRRRRNG